MAVSWHRLPLTESALQLLRVANRDLHAAKPLAVRPPRISGPHFGTLDPTQVRYQAALLRMVSTTEAYLDSVNDLLMRRHFQAPTRPIQSMVEELGIGSSRSWQARHSAFKKLHGVRLRKQSSWKVLEGAIEARNGIAHGIGRLTPTQLRNADLQVQLKRVDITVGGGRMIMSDNSLAVVLEACVCFVRSVDRAVPL